MLFFKYSIYVPSTKDVNTPADNAAEVQNTLAFLAERFGGATAYDARGAWQTVKDGKQLTVTEPVTICVAYCSARAYFAERAAVVAYCRTLCANMTQDAISLETRFGLRFIEAK